MSRKTFQEKLIMMNYNLLTTTTPKGKEDNYDRLSKNLSSIFGFAFCYLYIYDQWTNCFKLVSTINDDNLHAKIRGKDYLSVIENDENLIPIKKSDIFKTGEENLDIVAIPIQPSGGLVGMVVCGFSTYSITEEVIHIIKEETEKIVNVTQESLLTAAREQKLQLLYEMTTKFLVLTNKTDILIGIISSFREMYPDFEVILLLSQDHDNNTGLPIRTIELNDQTASSQAFQNGEIQIENRIREKDTCVYAPLKGYQGVYGVLQIIIPAVMEVPHEEVVFIKKFSNTAGMAIESTALYQNSNHLVSDLKLINDLTHQLNSNLDLIEITGLVRNQITQICQPEEIGFIYNRQGNKSHQYEVIDGSTDFFGTLTGKGFIKELIDNVLNRKEPIFSGDYKATGVKVPYRSVMVLPMENAGIIKGIMVVLGGKPYSFTFDHFKLLQSIIRHSTLAFVNTILAERLKKAASTDYLTQLYSRNYLDENIIHHMDKGEEGTLILFDIDNFKRVNDKFGHYVGDEVIKQVANIIMENIEEHDIAARWGGEELAIYLPNTDLTTGVHLARNINTEVESFTEPRVTLSAGVSSWTMKEDDDARNFFIRTDKALYEAKSYGKNCVVKYSKKDQEKESLQVLK